MKTMYKGLVNSPETSITNNISANDTIIYVLDPTRIPSDLPNLMVLGTGTNAETVKVTAIEGNALTVERGFQGIAKDWLAGTIIARNFTEYDYAALVDNINELELTKETPDGAQAKADTAEGNAKTYASDLIGVLSNLKTTVKDKIVSAINELFDNLASHKAEDVTQEDVIQTTEVNDSMKVPSSAVTYGINQKFEGLSFLSLTFPGKVKFLGEVTDVAELDNCKNTGVYGQNIPGSYARVLTFNMGDDFVNNVIQIRAYDFTAKLEIRHCYGGNWTGWVTLIP